MLAEDGRHREPDAEDISRIEGGLRQAGIGGWLAIMSQSAYAPGLPEVIQVRALGSPAAGFDDARRVLLKSIAEQQSGEPG